MPASNSEEKLLRILRGSEDPEVEERAPSRLKAQVFSALIREQQTTGPLQTLTATQATGHDLCVFEKLVQISPVPEQSKAPFFCWVCHARVLAEDVENAPIFWPNCPYADFQKP